MCMLLLYIYTLITKQTHSRKQKQPHKNGEKNFIGNNVCNSDDDDNGR